MFLADKVRHDGTGRSFFVSGLHPSSPLSLSSSLLILFFLNSFSCFPLVRPRRAQPQRERISFARAAHEVTTRARSRFLASRCHCFASWFLKDDAVSSVAAVLAQLHVYSDQRHSGKPALSCLICRKKLALVAIYSWLRKTTDG